MNRINFLGYLLLVAAKRGDLSGMNAVVLQSHVENVREAVLNWEDEKGETPLIAAAKTSRIKSVARLLLLGVNVNHKTRVRDNHGGETALHALLQKKRWSKQVLRLLLNAGAKQLIENSDGKTIMEVAQQKREGRRKAFLLSALRSSIANDVVFEFECPVEVSMSEALRARLFTGLRDRRLRIKVLHRYGGPEGKTYLRSMIAVMDNRSRWRRRLMKYWINVVDLDPPSVDRQTASWNITFKCHPLARAETRLTELAFKVPLANTVRHTVESFIQAIKYDPMHYISEASEVQNIQLTEDRPGLTRDLNLVVQQLNAVSNEDPNPMDTSPSSPLAQENQRTCVICLDRPVSTGFVHGSSVHCCACSSCAPLFTGQNAKCPLCQQAILTIATEFYI